MRIILTILFGLIGLLTSIHVNSQVPYNRIDNFTQVELRRIAVLKTAESYLGIKEKTGRNDGPEIKRFLNYVGLPEGNPWCAAVICEMYGKNNVCNPKSGYSPTFFPKKYIVSEPKPADAFGIYFPSLKRIAHVGIYITSSANGKWIETYEGNTNAEGSREGNVFAKRKRLATQIRMYADWFKETKCPHTL